MKGGNSKEIKISKKTVELPDVSKGIAARAFFYVLFTYGPDIFINTIKEIEQQQKVDPNNTRSKYFTLEIIEQMIEWNKNPPTDIEKAIYNKKKIVQGNNNPFIDNYGAIDVSKMILKKGEDPRSKNHIHINISADDMINPETTYLLSIPNIKLSDFFDLFDDSYNNISNQHLLTIGYKHRPYNINKSATQLRHEETQTKYYKLLARAKKMELPKSPKLRNPHRKKPRSHNPDRIKPKSHEPSKPSNTAHSEDVPPDTIHSEDELPEFMDIFNVSDDVSEDVVSGDVSEDVVSGDVLEEQKPGGYNYSNFVHHCY